MARISLAAAIAAGVPSLSGGGCCAPAGTAPRASPMARPAADKILKRRFILFSSIAALRPFNNANSAGACQHRHAGQTNEQPMLDHARYRGQQARQARHIDDSSEMGVD